jgi:hypothetical protein
MTHEERVARNLAFARVLASIRDCPDRGDVFPHTQQPGCGCAELTACRAGKGRDPGKATTADCMRCQGAGTSGAVAREST